MGYIHSADKKTKKEAAVADFQLPNAEDLDLLRQERAGSAERVAQFNKNFVPTGSAFKDTGLLSGTSRDVKRTREIDALFSKAADRQATTRGQDMEYTSQMSVTDMNRDRNRIMEKGGDQTHELGMGDLNLRRDAFTASKNRYDEFGRTADKINLGMLGARAETELGEYDYDANPFLTGVRDTVARPRQKIDAPVVDPLNSTAPGTTAAPVDEYEDVTTMHDIPEWLEPKAYTDYGKGLIPQTLGVASEIAKVPFRASYYADKALDLPMEALFGTKVSRQFPRKTRQKVAKKRQ